jgi:hypothetical protein
MNPYTQTPVNAVWFVMVWAGVCGLLGFSLTALASLAGYAFLQYNVGLCWPWHRAAVIGLYTSYVVPIFLRITYGRDKLPRGPFSLGRWYMPIGVVAVAWVTFIVILLLFPPGQSSTPKTMSQCTPIPCHKHVTDLFCRRLRGSDHWRCFHFCLGFLDRFSPQMVHRASQDHRRARGAEL